jgi:hypothetical protein
VYLSLKFPSPTSPEQSGLGRPLMSLQERPELRHLLQTPLQSEKDHRVVVEEVDVDAELAGKLDEDVAQTLMRPPVTHASLQVSRQGSKSITIYLINPVYLKMYIVYSTPRHHSHANIIIMRNVFRRLFG